MHADPTLGLERRPAPADRTRALTRDQIAALFALQIMPGLPPTAGGKPQRVKVGLRERTYWRLLYETAARAAEILNLNLGDLDLPNKRARVVSTGVRTGSLTLALAA